MMGVADRIVMERARVRRVELQEEERIEEEMVREEEERQREEREEKKRREQEEREREEERKKEKAKEGREERARRRREGGAATDTDGDAMATDTSEAEKPPQRAGPPKPRLKTMSKQSVISIQSSEPGPSQQKQKRVASRAPSTAGSESETKRASTSRDGSISKEKKKKKLISEQTIDLSSASEMDISADELADARRTVRKPRRPQPVQRSVVGRGGSRAAMDDGEDGNYLSNITNRKDRQDTGPLTDEDVQDDFFTSIAKASEGDDQGEQTPRAKRGAPIPIPGAGSKGLKPLDMARLRAVKGNNGGQSSRASSDHDHMSEASAQPRRKRREDWLFSSSDAEESI
ncbi:hypothetical protein CONPUDRAFT_138230 [Coniophora puteana RWD-64-598 SS2]|uniref:Uncharacterized protein n=1 Tax=Coniophora puteana (strain RWD-64-598) TaxID=741705 RepID=A0A5M3MJY6_CONPW|nr:uncharacterized protein CONPUDRAFT_138230 [Coniophora puteana RWD-64-598 SS2]EIW78975.1 hypothetical protein CONPUDRAFT_138230 [Coniophora puteana RWD-64-598 SS2]